MSVDYFFLGTSTTTVKTTGATYSSKQLKQKLKTAGLPLGGSRKELVERHDQFVRDTLAEAGMHLQKMKEDMTTKRKGSTPRSSCWTRSLAIHT